LKRLILGSVADKVLRGADTPLLMYRPTDDPAIASV
jgi:nucleotide-binding universal stress UspA family protein